jgi:hypothetical protein
MARNQQSEQEVETPMYELTEAAYIDDKLYTAGQRIAYEGIPGHHMEPINDSARAMKESNPSKFVDPILAMTIVN